MNSQSSWVPTFQLWEEIHGSDNRTGYELGEKGEIQEKVYGMFAGLELFSIYVNGVTHALKRVERDSHGQDEAQVIGRVVNPQECAHTVKQVLKQVEVFKKE